MFNYNPTMQPENSFHNDLSRMMNNFARGSSPFEEQEGFPSRSLARFFHSDFPDFSMFAREPRHAVFPRIFNNAPTPIHRANFAPSFVQRYDEEEDESPVRERGYRVVPIDDSEGWMKERERQRERERDRERIRDEEIKWAEKELERKREMERKMQLHTQMRERELQREREREEMENEWIREYKRRKEEERELRMKQAEEALVSAKKFREERMRAKHGESSHSSATEGMYSAVNRLREEQSRMSEPMTTQEQAIRNLKERLDLYGFRERQIPPDGNCQFASCSDQLYGDLKYHYDIRRKCVEWLRENKDYKLPNSTVLGDYLQTDFFQTWDEYCDYLEKDTVWGDHFTLIAIAELFRTKIVIISSVQPKPDAEPFITITPKSWDKSSTIYLSHLHELHYSSIVPESEKVSP